GPRRLTGMEGECSRWRIDSGADGHAAPSFSSRQWLPSLPELDSPTPTPSAAIVVNLVATAFQWSVNGGGNSFVMHVGQTYELHISDGDPAGRIPHGFSGIPALGISARALQPGNGPVVVTFTPRSGQNGNFFFSCNQSSCGSGHSDMVGTIQIMS
ncbi:MAG TPA: hypothetical protein VF376_09210, partial [Thermoanaerobaculia bacterium]